MSCLPGTPCFGQHTQTTYPRGCGLDPCTTFKTSTDLVFYTGPNLPCIDVHTCDNMSLILQKIDDALCGTNLVQNIIDTLINNTDIFNQFCTQIIQQCIDCDYIQDCVISTTSTSTTLHPICFGCGTYQLTNNSTYEEVVKFIDCSGITPCWTEITIDAGQSLYVCACDGSITSGCDVTTSFIAQGCSIPCVCKTYALINTQYDFDVTFNFDDCNRNNITVIVPGVFAGSPPVRICACEDSLPINPNITVTEVSDGCVPITCDFTFSLEIFTTTTTSSSTSSTSTTSTTTTCACERYNLSGSVDDYLYYNCDGDVQSGSTTDLTFCADINYGAITHGGNLTLTNLGCCTLCYTALAPNKTLFITLSWTNPDGSPGSQYIPSFEDVNGYYGPICAKEGTMVATGMDSASVTIVGGTDSCATDGDCPPVCMCYQINNLTGGCTIDYIACDGTVVTEYALSDTIICAQVGSVSVTRGPICEPGLYTPLGTSCITDAGCQCNCIEITSTEVSPYEYKDCDNVVQAGSVSFGSPLNVCGNIDSAVPFLGTSYDLTGNGCIAGKFGVWECPSLCNCITFVNTCLDCPPITYSYVDCNGDPVVDQPIANGETIDVCGSAPTTSDPGNVDIYAGGPCVPGGFGYVCAP